MTPEPKESRSSSSSSWGTATIGFEFVAAIAGFAIIGYLIDRWQGTSPAWTISLTLIGFVGGTYNLFKVIRRIQSGSAQRTPRRVGTGIADPRAASPEVAAGRGRPRPKGRVDLFSSQELDSEDLDGVELDWPEDERDRIEEDLRDAEEFGADLPPSDEDPTR